LVLEAGRVLAQGFPQDVLSRPRTESIAQLAGFENIFDCEVSAFHIEQGTMTCPIVGFAASLEVPLVRVDPSQKVRVGIRAGDILLGSSSPKGLSARNVLEGTVTSLEQQDVTVIARVNCAPEFVVHLTPGGRHALQLETGSRVWLIIKTYSCHVLQ